MISRTHNLIKNTFIIGVGTFCTKLISLFLVPFYTIWLAPVEYGEFDLLISYLTLLVPFVTLQLEQAILKFSLNNQKNKFKYLYNSLIVTIITIIITNIVCLFILKDNNVKLAFVLYFDSYSIFVLVSEYLRGSNKLKRYSLCNIIASVLILILTIVLVPILKLGINGLMYSYAIAYLLIDIFILLTEKVFANLKNEKFDKETTKKMLIYSMPLIPNGISWWVTNVSDRTLIKVLIGQYYNGLYAIGCKVPTLLSLVYSIFNLSWQQTAILMNSEDNKFEYYKKIFNSLISFLFTGSFVILLLLPFCFKYIISIDYYNALYFSPILLLGSIFLSFAQFLGGIMISEEKTKRIGMTTTIAAIINIIINIVLLKTIGLFAASISTLVSYIYMFVSRYRYNSKIVEPKTVFLIVKYSALYILISLVSVLCNKEIYLAILLTIIIILFINANKYLIMKVCKHLVLKKQS